MSVVRRVGDGGDVTKSWRVGGDSEGVVSRDGGGLGDSVRVVSRDGGGLGDSVRVVSQDGGGFGGQREGGVARWRRVSGIVWGTVAG
jgi:hypothetical protein